ncbi:MAG: pirin family protein [Myxococcaceae bacterium]|nr:pirin family protein [Myxococcaceae bacterium]
MSRITRRMAVGGAAAASVSLAASCKTSVSKQEKQAVSAPNHEQQAAILNVKPLSFPWATPDPFLFCVHHNDAYPTGNDVMGPTVSLAGRNMGQDFENKDGWNMYHGQRVPGFPQHPHRGFETVTVVRRGLLDHSDSMGAAARYGQGDVQWLTAGKGILHSEMFPLIDKAQPNPVELFQIWLNLPKADKMATPYFSMLWADTVPHHVMKDTAGRAVELTTVAGMYGESKPPSPPPSSWAARADSDVAIWTIKLAPLAQWTLPAAVSGSNRMLYYFQGSGLKLGGRELLSKQSIALKADVAVGLEAGADGAELLMLQGRPIKEPVVQYGPFVMNSREEIQSTFYEYQRTQFGGWPWPSDEPVHPREEGRFARRSDGSIEKPA